MQLTKEEDLPLLLAILASGIVAVMSRVLFQWEIVGYIFLPLTTLLILILASKMRKYSAKVKYKNLIMAALLVSLFADAILQFSSKNNIYFLIGVGLFAIAQILFSASFWSGKKFYKKDIIPFFVFAVYGIYMFLILDKKIKGDMTHIVIYLILICIMGWRAAATLYRRVFTSSQKFLILAGALFFIVSDTLLAIDLFIQPIEWDALWILPPYFLAQSLFALSIRERHTTEY